MGDQIQLGLRICPTRALVRADVMDVEHVLLTLALHARGQMPYGGMLVIETVVLEPTHESAEGAPAHGRVSVSDTGSGEAVFLRSRAHDRRSGRQPTVPAAACPSIRASPPRPRPFGEWAARSRSIGSRSWAPP
jgi:hypothetical protein